MLRILRSGSCRPSTGRRPRAAESGQAMLVVMAALALLATVPLTVMATTVDQLPLSTYNLDWNAAYQAAQAGLSDYIQHLDANETYVQYDRSNPDGNVAFTGWEAVSSTTAPPEYFEYSVSTSGGSLQLTVSGKAGAGTDSVVRTFTYALAPTSTLDDIYWTACESSSNCGATQEIVFDSNDVLNGPVFSDDDFFICGDPTFTSTVQSANDGDGPTGGMAAHDYWENTCGTSNPDFEAPPNEPTYAPPENILSNGVGGDVAPAEDYGCYLTAGGNGVTFTLSGTTLQWTGGTLNTTNGNKGAGCGSSGTSVTFADLQSAIFYVDGDVTINGGGTVAGFLTLVSSGSITLDGSVTYPSGDVTQSSGSPSGPYSDTKDALGLIALDYIYMNDDNAAITIDAAMMAISDSFENVDYTKACSGTCNVLTVFGSIAQNIRGPVGEESSGTVTNGYAKSYWYDYSLEDLWPPFFIPPASATWSPTSYAELQPGAAHEAIAGT